MEGGSNLAGGICGILGKRVWLARTLHKVNKVNKVNKELQQIDKYPRLVDKEMRPDEKQPRRTRRRPRQEVGKTNKDKSKSNKNSNKNRSKIHEGSRNGRRRRIRLFWRRDFLPIFPSVAGVVRRPGSSRGNAPW